MLRKKNKNESESVRPYGYRRFRKNRHSRGGSVLIFVGENMAMAKSVHSALDYIFLDFNFIRSIDLIQNCTLQSDCFFCIALASYFQI